ncbi:MAG: hypothetical protein HN742_30730 [Lentisphaerae bacterium]|jgi:2-keto-3-deoxy-L-rhamnonate aldolase RhmA|nr:hypothetical protein [Lentisphaerota bacterium]MBT4821743.1 hypothetical protein [Lentisphaerota bacterium]MBT5604700.1 hypothetical protein [Lentisphaerota bacterium]MBT7055115.1 hypothetical protein [Lentisphaerota bacterium]MBT7846287.1 hypothetical protein [Lentisphaerota bacterium]
MTLKERVHSDAPLHIGMLSVELSGEEIRAKAEGQGWDLAFVDLQHAPYSEPQLAAFLTMATEAGVPIMLRTPHPDAAWLSSRLLDFGAAAVLIPMVETSTTVEDAVANVYYPPLGNRSCGLRLAYGYDPAMSPRGYADWWNANGILAIQIETIEAVLSVRNLVQRGVDLILFGGTDLSFSLGVNPDCPFTSVAECRQYVFEQTEDLDVRVGMADLPFGRF